MIENRIIIVASVILLFLAVLIIIFIYITIQKMKQDQRNMKIQHYIKEYSDNWYDYLVDAGSIEKLAGIESEYERMAIDEILTRYAKNISGKNVLNRISIFAELHLQDYYRDMLRSKSWSIRMNILNKILDLQLRFLIDDVLNMLEREKKYSNEEYFVMYKILSLFKGDDLIDYLLHPKFKLGEFEYKKILFHIDQNLLEELVEKFADLPIALQYVVIDIIGIRGYIEHTVFLESLLVRNERELRIRALKSIGQIGHVTNIDNYIPFITSDTWEERLMIVKIIKHLPISQSSSYLELLMRDSSWWVRKEAAITLSSQKDGIEVLKSIIISADDSYATDMAKEVLGKE